MSLKIHKDKLLESIGVPLVAVILALICGAFFIMASGSSPISAYKLIFLGSLGNVRALSEVMVKMAPLLLAGLSLGIAFSTGAFAIGAEGQILMGGLAAAFVGVYLADLPGFLLIPLCILASILAGAIWAAIPGALYAYRKLDIVINTIMFNYIAFYLVNYFIAGPFQDPAGLFPQSPTLAGQAWMPRLMGRMHIGVILAILAAFFIYWLIVKTPFGIQIKASGFNRKASRYAGINVNRTIFITIMISGALAGLAGAGEVMGLHHRVMSNFSSNYGWNAIAVALLGRLHPLGILVSAFFWAALMVGANSMQRVLQIPSSLIVIIQSIAIFFILASEILKRKKNIGAFLKGKLKFLGGREKRSGNSVSN
jgi:simple sugar transport system permease protein